MSRRRIRSRGRATPAPARPVLVGMTLREALAQSERDIYRETVEQTGIDPLRERVT